MEHLAFFFVPARILVSACIVLVGIKSGAAAEELRLGTIAFPTSARSAEAQAHFERGVAALHSFWYPVALEEFRAASRIEPDFAMAYWGEAMVHTHPVWGDPQDTEAGRAALSRLPSTADRTPREQAYLDAAAELYGEGNRPTRDRAYAEAMERLHRNYPKDLEAAAFYSLALLGVAYGEDGDTPRDPADVRQRMRAAAVAQQVYREQPDHPGAAHYILHAFDDPTHAILALPAARRYAEIAPSAPHALHMPSHIFLQLGRWEDAADSNRESLAAARADDGGKFHSLHWLLYALLQLGREDEARPLLMEVRKAVAEVPEADVRNRLYGAFTQSTMEATFLIETERWDAASDILGEAPADAAQTRQGDGSQQALTALSKAPSVFARALAAAMREDGNIERAIANLEMLRDQIADSQLPFAAAMAPVIEIQALELAAAAKAARGDLDGAIKTASKAAELEDARPLPAGPPQSIKPAHELLGEMLLRAGRDREAENAFSDSLFRHPGRRLSLDGQAQLVERP